MMANKPNDSIKRPGLAKKRKPENVNVIQNNNIFNKDKYMALVVIGIAIVFYRVLCSYGVVLIFNHNDLNNKTSASGLLTKKSYFPTYSESGSKQSISNSAEKKKDLRFVRKPAEVTLMGAELATEYEITNAENISPYIRYLDGPPMNRRKERAMGARFRNFYKFTLTMWWDDGSEKGVYSGIIHGDQDTTTNTYTTHKFHFRRKETNELVASFTMNDDNFLYIIGPDKEDEATFKSKRYQDTLSEIKFMKDYYKQHGVPWLSFYPRPKPIVYMHPADFPGQMHRIRSHVGYFESTNAQSDKPIDFNVIVASVKPRVLIIPGLLNDFEVDHITEMGKQVLGDSRVGSGSGGFKSKTRTSKNGWLRRKSSSILDIIYYRFADVLGMKDEQLQDDYEGNAENLQFVEYKKSQEYAAHHDFGNTGRVNQRFSTLLIYLNVPEDGGGTSFPKAYDGQGIRIKPKSGDAVLFYSMLPDGNGDDLSLHAGMPVIEGVKYICNLWIWDPKRYF